MTYLKYVQYLYLLFGVFFIYDGITKAMRGEDYILSALFALAAIGMFFFRRKFANKYKNKD
jgi:uncharacterized membrane protein